MLIKVYLTNTNRDKLATGKKWMAANLAFFLLFVNLPLGIFSQVDPVHFTRNLWHEFRATGNDSLKIEKLSKLAFFYNDYLDDHVHADSVSELAIRIEAEKIGLLKDMYHNRFGQFLLRHGNKEKALAKFTRSYQLAEKASYFEYMVIASGQIESLCAATGDYKNAYNYAVLNKVLADSIDNLTKKDQILVMEIDHEQSKKRSFPTS